MRYTILPEAYGQYEAYRISSPDGAIQALIITGYGASVQELILITPEGRSLPVFAGYDSPEDLAENGPIKFRGAILYPFPNRVAGGEYEFGGRSYQLARNDGPRPNALHGLFYDQPLEVIGQHTDEQSASLTMRAITPRAGTESGYPFSTTLELTYSISRDGMMARAYLTNHGQTDAPVGVSYHPYFFTEGSLSECLLELPLCEALEVDDVLIPTGKQTPFVDHQTMAPLGERQYDTAFEFTDHQSRRLEVTLRDPSRQVSIHSWQGAGPSGMNFLQIYTDHPKGQIAIEPMSCAPDAFRTGQGLCVLAPGASAEYSFGLYLR